MARGRKKSALKASSQAKMNKLKREIDEIYTKVSRDLKRKRKNVNLANSKGKLLYPS